MNNPFYNSSKTSQYYTRISIAKKQAEDATELPLLDRLKKYSFIQRYNKPLKKLDLKKVGVDKEMSKRRKTKKIIKNENSSLDKNKLLKQNNERLTKQQNRSGKDLKMKPKKFKRICTISSFEDSSDISVILDDINFESSDNIDLAFLDNL